MNDKIFFIGAVITAMGLFTMLIFLIIKALELK